MSITAFRRASRAMSKKQNKQPSLQDILATVNPPPANLLLPSTPPLSAYGGISRPGRFGHTVSFWNSAVNASFKERGRMLSENDRLCSDLILAMKQTLLRRPGTIDRSIWTGSDDEINPIAFQGMSGVDGWIFSLSTKDCKRENQMRGASPTRPNVQAILFAEGLYLWVINRYCGDETRKEINASPLKYAIAVRKEHLHEPGVWQHLSREIFSRFDNSIAKCVRWFLNPVKAPAMDTDWRPNEMIPEDPY